MLVAAAALRLVFMLAYRPALVGFPDSAVYLQDAVTNPFWDQLRVVGYGYFLRGAAGIGLNLSAIVLVQHALGMAGALALWDAVRRVSGSAALGLAPCAVVLFGGDQLFLEHAVLSESLFTFIVCGTLWFAVRAQVGGVGYAIAAGAGAGLLATVRLAGIAILPVVVLAAVRLRAIPRVRGLIRPAAALIAGAVVLVGYLGLHAHHTDRWSFTNSGSYNLYGRAAVFADCREFDPPAGTAALCEQRPPSERPGPDYYNFDGGSPAARAFGGSAQFPPPPGDVQKLSEFARAAVVGQPIDYARVVLRDLGRFVAPERWASQSGNSPAALRERLFDQNGVNGTAAAVQQLSGTVGVHRRERLIDLLKDYESYTRVQGPLMVVLVLLALAAPFVTKGRERRGAILFAATAGALIVLPVLTVLYDIRYAVPSYGPLAAAAACGAHGLRRAILARRARIATAA